MAKRPCRTIILYLFCFLLALSLIACGKDSDADTSSAKDKANEEVSENIKEKIPSTAFNSDDPYSHLTDYTCLYDTDDEAIICTASMTKAPKSDDDYLYFFAFDAYEDYTDLSKEPIASAKKDFETIASILYEPSMLFKRYVPAIKVDGEYIALADGLFVQNPESMAANQMPYPDFKSKKGLLVDTSTVNTDLLDDLNITHAVVNMPLSFFLGSADADLTMVEYEFDGTTYYFKESSLEAYDTLFTNLNSSGMEITAIILNDYNETDQTLIHPLSREKTKKSKYYQFNTTDEAGVRELEAIALFLSERYTNGEHGTVINWVIANEINQQKIWNYMDTEDIDYYMESFEKSFRIFYNAIKSNYANARIYYSIDHDWNDNGGDNSQFFNSRDIVTTFNKYALTGGNYDWSLAIHPYPVPLTKVNYWSQEYDMSVDASTLTIMNLSTLTSFMSESDLLNPDGEVRSIAITELGYTSKYGENLQAAAFAYGYLIADNNDYIDMFLLNRQVDSTTEMRSGLYLGLYSIDYTPKVIKDIFANIDNPDNNDYEKLLLNVIDASSIEEALSWANP